MAGRLISPPVGLPVLAIEPLTGPRAVGASASQSGTGFVQTASAAFGLLRFQFAFAPMREGMFRRYRGWVTALHGGANATRWDFYDPDTMRPAEAGLDVPDAIRWDMMDGTDWANDEPWSNGKPWLSEPPTVAVADAAALGATEIRLADAYWGHRLDAGDYLGFAPYHFGLYAVTEVIETGTYRIWPPLRKAITTDDVATLRPTLAMRLESEDAASAGRGLVTAENAAVTLVETLDYDVRDYFTD